MCIAILLAMVERKSALCTFVYSLYKCLFALLNDFEYGDSANWQRYQRANNKNRKLFCLEG